MSTLASRLQQALDAMKPPRKQADLMRACKLKNASVSNWMSGKTKQMKGANLLKAAAYLNVRPAWLAEGVGPMRAVGSSMPDIGTAIQARETAPPEYIAATQRDDLLKSWLDLLADMSPARWDSVRQQLDGYVAGSRPRDAIVAELRFLLAAQPWDHESNRRADGDRRTPGPDSPQNGDLAA